MMNELVFFILTHSLLFSSSDYALVLYVSILPSSSVVIAVCLCVFILRRRHRKVDPSESVETEMEAEAILSPFTPNHSFSPVSPLTLSSPNSPNFSLSLFCIDTIPLSAHIFEIPRPMSPSQRIAYIPGKYASRRGSALSEGTDISTIPEGIHFW